MRLTFQTIKNWLNAHASECSLDQLSQLDRVLQRGLAAAHEAETRAQQLQTEARAAAEEAAKKLGVPVDEFLRMLQANQPALSTALQRVEAGLAPRTSVRKPFMNPYADDGKLWANPLSHPDREKPDWWPQAEADGISIEMCHYRRLEDTWRLKGMPKLFDPLKRHAELIAQEPVRYQRPPPRRPRSGS